MRHAVDIDAGWPGQFDRKCSRLVLSCLRCIIYPSLFFVHYKPTAPTKNTVVSFCTVNFFFFCCPKSFLQYLSIIWSNREHKVVGMVGVIQE